MVLVITNKEDSYTKTLQSAWLNGKKNDIVIVIGSKVYPTIDWVDVFGWSNVDIVNVKTRDDIKDYGKIDTKVIDIATDNINKYWQRKHMSDFKYLQKEIEPSDESLTVIGLVALILIGIASYVSIKNSV